MEVVQLMMVIAPKKKKVPPATPGLAVILLRKYAELQIEHG